MRLPQFTIRDLMWLTVVASLAVSWTLDHRIASARAGKARLDVAKERRFAQGRIAALEEQVKALCQQFRAREESAAAQP
jgi:hypothetical protein